MALFKFGEILIPAEAPVSSWAVVACDQYTSDKSYWDRLYAELPEPTTLKLIFPECYLGSDNSARVSEIINKQNQYLNDKVFRSVDGTVLVKRKTSCGNERWGLMCLIDLDEYSTEPGSHAPIRATEGLVASRIPPRVEIRKNCPLELPHVMLLIDDKRDTVIGPLKDRGEVLYDGELNSGGGHITGYGIKDVSSAQSALEALKEESEQKYGSPLLFLVGDGNHSLATAKACRDENNPLSRYALAEIVNIYDDGLKFEPIHRAVFGVDNERFLFGLSNLTSSFNGKTMVYDKGTAREIPFPQEPVEGVGIVQKYIDEYIAAEGGTVDYIHGKDELKDICINTGAAGICLSAMDKNSFFSYVAANGVLPRKTFSMGEANEKRYYMEARLVKKQN